MRSPPIARSHRAVAVLVLSLAGPVTAAPPPAAATPAAPAAATVRLEHFMFGPATITVAAGATVEWRNLDGEPHTVVSLDGLFRSGALDQGDTYRYTFPTPGSYRYVCSIHPQMVGTIVVSAAAAAPAAGPRG
ncbi:MAG: cupredoxin family copper-binding protein [Proteobacteria bacterium]|nr:cupredoxin family copper-binding protein [Pseudomonadota bacterium]